MPAGNITMNSSLKISDSGSDKPYKISRKRRAKTPSNLIQVRIKQ